MVVAFLVLIGLSGCGSKPMGDKPPAAPEDQALLPIMNREPILWMEDEQLWFQWPWADWHYLTDSESHYAIQSNWHQMIRLDPVRQVIYPSKLDGVAQWGTEQGYSLVDVHVVAQGGLLTVETPFKTKRLYHIRDFSIEHDPEILIEFDGDMPPVVISPDKSKTTFRAPLSGKLTVVNHVTGRVVSLPEMMSENAMEDLDQYVQFSPQGGYLTISRQEEDSQRNHFITYGTDTGRMIHDWIAGETPIWDPNEEMITYLYPGNNPERTEDGRVKPNLIAVYSLQRRDTSLVSILQDGEWIQSPVWITDNGRYLVFISGTDENQDISVFNREEQVLRKIPLSSEMRWEPGDEAGFKGNMLAMEIRTNQGTGLIMTEIPGGNPAVVQKVTDWSFFSLHPEHENGGMVVTVGKQGYLIRHGQMTPFFQMNENHRMKKMLPGSRYTSILLLDDNDKLLLTLVRH